MRISDWSSEVCSSDLAEVRAGGPAAMEASSFMAIMSPPDQQIAIRLAEQPSGYLPGASVRILSGDAAGRQLFVTGVFGDTLLLDGFGADGTAKADGVRSGEQGGRLEGQRLGKEGEHTGRSRW